MSINVSKFLVVACLRIIPAMKSMEVGGQNRMLSPGKTIIFKTLFQFFCALRMMFMCKKYPKNRERYRSICAATLITSLHALTSFHCMDTGRDSGPDTCFKRDLSDGKENRVIFGCLNSAKVAINKIGAYLACCLKKFMLGF